MHKNRSPGPPRSASSDGAAVLGLELREVVVARGERRLLHRSAGDDECLDYATSVFWALPVQHALRARVVVRLFIGTQNKLVALHSALFSRLT